MCLCWSDSLLQKLQGYCLRSILCMRRDMPSFMIISHGGLGTVIRNSIISSTLFEKLIVMRSIKDIEELVYPITIWTQGMTENFEYNGTMYDEATEYESLSLHKAAEILMKMPIPPFTKEEISKKELAPSAIGDNNGIWSISIHGNDGEYYLWNGETESEKITLDIVRALEFLIQMYVKILEIRPEDIDLNSQISVVCNYVGGILTNQGKHEEALKVYSHSVTLDRKSTLALNNLGVYLDTLEKYEEAIEIYREAIEIDPQDAHVWGNLGTSLEKLRLHEDAADAYRRVIEIDPQNANGWNNLGFSLQNLERYEEAVDVYRQAIEIDPQDALTWEHLGVCLGNLERYEEAVNACKRSIAIEPRDQDPWNHLGSNLEKLERFDEAIDAYKRSVKIYPLDVQVWTNLGYLLRKLGRHEEVVDTYKSAVEFNPHHMAAWFILGDALRRLNRLEEVVDSYRRAVDLNPQETMAWVNLGDTLGELGRYEDAVNAYKQSLEIDSQLLIWSSLGKSLGKLGRYEEAVDAYRRVVERFPQDIKAWLNLGDSFRELGKLEDAADAYRQVVEINSRNIMGWQSLVETLEKLGKQKEAEAASRQIAKITPSFVPARDWAKEIEKKTGYKFLEETESKQSSIVSAVRGWNFIDGKFEYKIKVGNDSESVITNVCFQIVAYPENLEISGETSRTQAKIEPRGFGAHSYTFLPTRDCVEGDIQATVSYLDHHNKLHVILVEAYTIRSVCDLLNPLDAALNQFDELILKLDKTSVEIVIDWNPEALFQRIVMITESKNFRIIDKQSNRIGNQFIGSLKGLAKGKYTEKHVALVIFIKSVDGHQTSVTIEVLGDDEAMLPVTSHELRSQLRPLVDLMKEVKVSTESIPQILEAIENLEGEVAELGRQTVAAVKILEHIELSSESQQEAFDHLLGSIEKLMEKLGAPKSKIKKVKDGLISGFKISVKEVSRFAIMILLQMLTGVG
ncbi:MAG: tetratricopeptide repeat protein [Candidatus Thorarchaeota archaeon]|nr:MAG: tetratricopeptide repeat protein [Candidatus Thorarchaeota archaeon]